MNAHLSPRDRAAALVLLLAGALIFGTLELARPGYFLWDDNATFFLPVYLHDYRALTEAGALAHVNFHQYLGQIHLGNGQSAVLYPPVYAAIWLAELVTGDPLSALDLLAVGHFLLAALGMLGLLRSLGVSRTIAVLASLTWMSFPFLLQVGRNWIFISYAAALLPWNFWLLERLLRAPGGRGALALAAVKAIFFYQGYPQYAVVTALFDGVYAFARLGLDRSLRPAARRSTLAYGAALAASLLLAAPVLLPMLDARRLSALRAEALPLPEFLANALPLAAFAKAQLFLMMPKAVHQASGAIFYAGLPNLLALAAVLMLHRRLGLDPRARAWALAALAGLLASTVLWVVVYPVPLLSSFRWHFKNYLLFLFFLVPAVAMLADRRPRLGRWLLGAGLAGNLAVLAVPAFDRPFGPHHLDRPVAELRAAAETRFPLGAGRVASLWIRHGDPEMVRRLTFNYATLVGGFHLAGYDPLIARENLDLALGLQVDSSYRRPLDPEVLAHLSAWNVRHLIVPARPEIERSLAEVSTLGLRVRESDLLVYENRAALPWARFVDAEQEAVALEWGVNEVRIDPGGRGGRLRLALAPLPWYEAEVDGQSAQLAVDAARFLILDVPPGARAVRVRYVDVPFRLGAGLLAAFLLGLVWVGYRRRATASNLTA